jgi:four helix bundle protein
MTPFDRLDAFRASYRVGLATYKATENWPKRELFGLTSQARRAATSISINIAEGVSKKGPREMRRYLDIALGSLAELQVILRFAQDLKLATEEEVSNLEKQRSEAGRLTWKLYKAIQDAAAR